MQGDKDIVARAYGKPRRWFLQAGILAYWLNSINQEFPVAPPISILLYSVIGSNMPWERIAEEIRQSR